MNPNSAFALIRIWPVILVGVFLASANSLFAGNHPKFEAQLVWATNDEKPPENKKDEKPSEGEKKEKGEKSPEDKKNEKPSEEKKDKTFKPVDEETRKNLESLGLKWKHFYEVKRVSFDAPNGESGKVVISEKSSISVKILKDKKVEVVFYGKKGEVCSRGEQTLKPGKMIVHGGNVPEKDTAWLVTLKQLK